MISVEIKYISMCEQTWMTSLDYRVEQNILLFRMKKCDENSELKTLFFIVKWDE